MTTKQALQAGFAVVVTADTLDEIVADDEIGGNVASALNGRRVGIRDEYVAFIRKPADLQFNPRTMQATTNEGRYLSELRK